VHAHGVSPSGNPAFGKACALFYHKKAENADREAIFAENAQISWLALAFSILLH
jgi:hypothetical protein